MAERQPHTQESLLPMSIAELLINILQIFSLILLARAIYSWVDPGMTSTIGRFLLQVTEPVVGPVRQVIPSTGMLDLSVMVTMILTIVLRQVITSAML